jgi:hypothetical protein
VSLLGEALAYSALTLFAPAAAEGAAA